MIIVTTRFNVAMGKTSVALDWAERIIKLVDFGHYDSKWWLLRQVAANPNTIAIAAEYPSMAAYEESMEKAAADPAFQAMIKEMAETDWALGNERTFAQVIKKG